jgi:pimeloyl-ACP methyl ester carboxylesterase
MGNFCLLKQKVWAEWRILFHKKTVFKTRYVPFSLYSDFLASRSPLHPPNLRKLSTPVGLLHGSEDIVVHPNQSQKIYEACLEKKIPAVLEIFEGEGHGFHKYESIKRALEVELFFYSKIFCLETESLCPDFEAPTIAFGV